MILWFLITYLVLIQVFEKGHVQQPKNQQWYLIRFNIQNIPNLTKVGNTDLLHVQYTFKLFEKGSRYYKERILGFCQPSERKADIFITDREEEARRKCTTMCSSKKS